MNLKSLATGIISLLPLLQALAQGDAAVQIKAVQEYAASSVLASGRWAKIAVTAEGIHRLDYSRIREMGITDPASAVLYGNNRGQLSFMNDGTAPDDLRKIAVTIEKGSDGVFNDGDYLLFYAEGTHRWLHDPSSGGYSFLRHHYSDTAWYFIGSQPSGPLVMVTETQPSTPPSAVSQSTDVLFRHEREEISLIRSGREWYQQVASAGQTPVGPDFTDLITSERIRYRLRVLGRSDSGTSFTLRQGTETIKTVPVPAVTMTDLNGVFAEIVTLSDSVMPSSSSPAFSLSFSSGGNMAATGYIDYVDFMARGRLVINDRPLIISDIRTVGSGKVTRFEVESSVSLRIWDVTDPFVPRAVQTTTQGGNTLFTAATDSLRKFLAFSASHIRQPVKIVPVQPQNLHALAPVDMIIVTHPLFRTYAERIAAIHLADDGTSSIVVTITNFREEFPMPSP